MIKLQDKTLLLLSSTGAAAFIFLALVEVKPNRIEAGLKYSGFSFLGLFGLFVLSLWISLAIASFYKKNGKNRFIFLASSSLIISLFWGLKVNSSSFVEVNLSSRISLSASFYLQILVIYLLFAIYTPRIKNHKALKIIGFSAIALMLYYLFISGGFNSLSIIKEYAIKKSQFYDNLKIHAGLTFASVISGTLIAVPLGFLAYSKKKLEGKIMLPLSIIETIPSLSLFGILLVPLSNLGKLPFFDVLGVSGIGWAPAFVALTLYTLLPIGRNTLTGFYSVDKAAIEAARGMGMSRSQILKQIELPLAFPVIFTGIRIAFIQTIGGAVLAGLVGGGGMGSFVFLGLGEASPDLILLGVLPIVVFTILLDYILKYFEKMIRRVTYD
nr:ABC transporter permease [Tissierella sp.]